jgi:hypothetical protein
MKWCSITHPKQHEKYLINIEPPGDITGLGLSHDNIDDDTYDMIPQIENDYLPQLID